MGLSFLVTVCATSVLVYEAGGEEKERRDGTGGKEGLQSIYNEIETSAMLRKAI